MMGEQFVTGQTIDEALANGRSDGGAGLPLFLRHARRGGRHRRATPSATCRTTSGRFTPSAAPPPAAASTKGPASRSNSRRCIRATAARSASACMAELYPRLKGLAVLARHYDIGAQHRCRGSRPAGDLARPAGAALLRAGTCGLERHRLRRPGLPEALHLRDRLDHRPRAPQPASPDGAAGQGRLLGQRDQARAGRRPRRFSGVHAQGPHRRLLPRLRPQAAGRAGRGVSAIRDPQRADARQPSTRWPAPNFYAGQYEFQCLHGMGEPLYEEVVGPAKARPAVPHLRAGRHARDVACLSGAPPAGERRQHFVRQPHRRSRRAGRRC